GPAYSAAFAPDENVGVPGSFWHMPFVRFVAIRTINLIVSTINPFHNCSIYDYRHVLFSRELFNDFNGADCAINDYSFNSRLASDATITICRECDRPGRQCASMPSAHGHNRSW